MCKTSVRLQTIYIIHQRTHTIYPSHTKTHNKTTQEKTFHIKMESLRVAIVVFAVVVSLFSSTTNGELITKCIVAYAQECPDQTSSAGIERCCSLMVNMYKNDADCLCSIYEYTSTDDETANDKLFECGINTNDSFSCNSDRDRSLLG